jgi:hypothetical protein
MVSEFVKKIWIDIQLYLHVGGDKKNDIKSGASEYVRRIKRNFKN